MRIYYDINGEAVTGYRLEGPTVLTTVFGECVGETGDWVVYLPDGRTHILPDDQFINSFKDEGNA